MQIVAHAAAASTSKSNEEITEQVKNLRDEAYTRERLASTQRLHRDAWIDKQQESRTCFGRCFSGTFARMMNKLGNHNEKVQKKLEAKANKLEKTKKRPALQ